MKNYENKKTIAVYCDGLAGIEIKEIENGLDDYVLCVSHYGKAQSHRIKVNYTSSGSAFFRVGSIRIPLDECMRV